MMSHYHDDHYAKTENENYDMEVDETTNATAAILKNWINIQDPENLQRPHPIHELQEHEIL